MTYAVKILENLFTWCGHEDNKCTFFVILQVKTLIAIVYMPQEKNMQIILNALKTYYYSQFYMATFHTSTHGALATLNAYLSFGVSINRMLILQLKIFLFVKIMFSL